MGETPRPNSPPWWFWAVAILLVIALNFFLLGFQHGECIDYIPESGKTSTCTTEPALGIAGTWLLGIVSVLAAIYFMRRLVQAVRARRD
jgi:hypothetical protein